MADTTPQNPHDSVATELTDVLKAHENSESTEAQEKLKQERQEFLDALRQAQDLDKAALRAIVEGSAQGVFGAERWEASAQDALANLLDPLVGNPADLDAVLEALLAQIKPQEQGISPEHKAVAEQLGISAEMVANAAKTLNSNAGAINSNIDINIAQGFADFKDLLRNSEDLTAFLTEHPEDKPQMRSFVFLMQYIQENPLNEDMPSRFWQAVQSPKMYAEEGADYAAWKTQFEALIQEKNTDQVAITREITAESQADFIGRLEAPLSQIKSMAEADMPPSFKTLKQAGLLDSFVTQALLDFSKYMDNHKGMIPSFETFQRIVTDTLEQKLSEAERKKDSEKKKQSPSDMASNFRDLMEGKDDKEVKADIDALFEGEVGASLRETYDAQARKILDDDYDSYARKMELAETEGKIAGYNFEELNDSEKEARLQQLITLQESIDQDAPEELRGKYDDYLDEGGVLEWNDWIGSDHAELNMGERLYVLFSPFMKMFKDITGTIDIFGKGDKKDEEPKEDFAAGTREQLATLQEQRAGQKALQDFLTQQVEGLPEFSFELGGQDVTKEALQALSKQYKDATEGKPEGYFPQEVITQNPLGAKLLESLQNPEMRKLLDFVTGQNDIAEIIRNKNLPEGTISGFYKLYQAAEQDGLLTIEADPQKGSITVKSTVNESSLTIDKALLEGEDQEVLQAQINAFYETGVALYQNERAQIPERSQANREAWNNAPQDDKSRYISFMNKYKDRIALLDDWPKGEDGQIDLTAVLSPDEFKTLNEENIRFLYKSGEEFQNGDYYSLASRFPLPDLKSSEKLSPSSLRELISMAKDKKLYIIDSKYADGSWHHDLRVLKNGKTSVTANTLNTAEEPSDVLFNIDDLCDSDFRKARERAGYNLDA